MRGTPGNWFLLKDLAAEEAVMLDSEGKESFLGEGDWEFRAEEAVAHSVTHFNTDVNCINCLKSHGIINSRMM